MDRFAGKIAVVTGASRGIGEAISKALLQRGVDVVGLVENSHEFQNASEKFTTQPKLYKGKFSALICDVSQAKNIEDTFALIRATYQSIAILVNNAGIALPITEKIYELKGEDFSRVLNVNARGSCLCSNEAVKLMTDTLVGGHIININSVLSEPHLSFDLAPVYSISKMAARTFSQSLRKEMIKERRNIKITNVSPGFANTDLPRSNGVELPEDSNQVLSVEDVADTCITALDTPPHIVFPELTVVAIHSEFQ